MQIDGGYMHTCGVDDTGHIHCWGSERRGEISMAPKDGRYVGVWAGLYRSCAVDKAGKATCWGAALDGSDNNAVTELPGNVVKVDPGDEATCAIDTKGQVQCVGTGPVMDGLPTESDLVELSVGYNHACVRRPEGSLYCWGKGSNADFDPPFQAVPPAWPVVDVAVGDGYHTCGLRRDGSVGCWGGDGSGDGGNVLAGHLRAPPGTFVEVTAGHNHSCARRLDGTVTCWGEVSDPPDDGGFLAITSGAFHACGLRKNSVVCWGHDQWKQVSATPGLDSSD